MTIIESPPVNILTLAERLKLLANPKRLQILHLLMEGVQCNCELGELLDMPPNLISHHLSLLRRAGLVDMERDAVDSRWVYYSLNQEEMAQINEMFGSFFDLARIKPRHPTCGPQNVLIKMGTITVKW